MAMNCEAFMDQIDAYIDGELESAVRIEMERHAQTCAPCMRMLKEAEALREMLSEMSEVDVPLPAQAAWRRAVREEAKAKRSPVISWMRPVASIAAALVVLVAGTLGMRMDQAVPTANEPRLLMASETGRESDWADQNGTNERTRATTIGYVTGALQSDGSTGATRSAEIGAGQTQPVVLRSAERAIESEKYDSDAQWLNDLVIEYGAYFEEREEVIGEAGSSGRISKAVIRVPSERLDDFLMELDQLGKTVRRSEAAEDVTGRYMDTQSRLDALQMQKDKLTEMMADSAGVEDLIAIDDKLTEVIAQMESLEGDLRRWTSEQSYSKVTLMMTEVFEAPSETEEALGIRMQKGFDGAMVWLKGFGQDLLVMLATYGPRLIIFVPVLALVLAVGCLIRSRKRR